MSDLRRDPQLRPTDDPRTGRWWVVVIALALLATACSGAGGSSQADAGGDTPQAAGESSSDDPTSGDGGATADESGTETPGTSGDAVDESSNNTADEEAPVELTGPRIQDVQIDGPSEYLFDQNQLHTFELHLSDEALASLDGDPTAEQYVQGTLTFEGRTIGPVGIRYKGSIGAFIGCVDGPDPFEPSGAKVCTKLSMKIRINLVNPGAEFFGQRRLQFHSMNLDPTMLHERLGYFMFAEMGVPAPRSVHARLVINGDFVGLFALTEQIDGRFTRHHYTDGGGNLYKEVWPFTADGELTSDAAFVDGLRTNEDDDGVSAELIRAFGAELIAASTDADRRAVIDRWMDVEEIISWAVVDRAIGHDDGPSHWYCFEGCAPHNFYWYEHPTDRTVHLIPWDLDNAFENLGGPENPVTPIADGWGEVSAECDAFAFGSFSLPQRSAACDPAFAAWALFADEYEQRRRELLDGPMSTERVNALLDQWADQIEDSVAEAAERYGDAPSVESWRAAVDQLKADLLASRS